MPDAQLRHDAGPAPITEPALLLEVDGARDRIRTCDLLLRRQTLYPLGYAGVVGR